MVMYPVLTAEIAKREIKRKHVAEIIGINERTLRNKMSGKTDFTWLEVNKIQSTFFPDIDVMTLFDTRANIG